MNLYMWFTSISSPLKYPVTFCSLHGSICIHYISPLINSDILSNICIYLSKMPVVKQLHAKRNSGLYISKSISMSIQHTRRQSMLWYHLVSVFVFNWIHSNVIIRLKNAFLARLERNWESSAWAALEKYFGTKEICISFDTQATTSWLLLENKAWSYSRVCGCCSTKHLTLRSCVHLHNRLVSLTGGGG